MNDHPHLILSVDAGVGVLELHHPEKRNALGWELHHELLDVLAAWAEDDAVACVLLIGNEDYFCSGWRLDVLDTIEGDERRRFTDLALKLMKALYDFPKPMVAAVAGVAPGYGMDLCTMCDITIASANAAFGSTQVKYAMNGFYHGLLQRVGPQRARRMFFTGDPIGADEALRVGLVDQVVPAGSLRSTSLELARQIAEMGAELAVVLKGVALRSGNMDHLSALAYELSVTQDLTQRGIFRQRVGAGRKRLEAGTSRAVERLEKP